MLYVVRDEIEITINAMARAADVLVRRSSTDSFVTGLVDNFKVTIIKIILILVHEIGA